MKKIKVILLLSLVGLGLRATAQTPRGNRILAWQIDLAENNQYDSAIRYGLEACMQSVHLAFTWSGIEPDTGQFDSAYMANTLDIANIYYPVFSMPVELQLATMNTTEKEVPAEFKGVPFDDERLIRRFKILLDTFFAHIPKLSLSALNIGNESDIYMGTDSNQYKAYRRFLDSVIPYAHQRYQELHGVPLKVGTTLTHKGLVSTDRGPWCKWLNKATDIVSVTYYPLKSDFTMDEPSVVATDFNELVNQYTDTSQGIYFAECGYSSSAICNSSEAKQAEFYQNVFTAWDKHINRINYLTIFKSTDWSKATVDTLKKYYKLQDTVFGEYLRSLGVRTWKGNGTNKLAFEQIKCELKSRNWCPVACNINNVSVPLKQGILYVYPNPVKNIIHIRSEKAVKRVKVYSITGMQLMETKETSFAVGKLPPGVYPLHIELVNGVTAYRRVHIKP